MNRESRKNIKIRWLFGDREISIEILSAISGLISTMVGVLALIIGVWQFNVALDKTDDQITYMENEKKERNAENRPIITVKDVIVEKNGNKWTFSDKVVNDGKRQADSMFSVYQVLAYDGNENLSDSYIVPIYSMNIEKRNGLFPQQSYNEKKTFPRIDIDIYLVKQDIRYRDIVSKEGYPMIIYYKVDLNHEPAKVTEYYEDQMHSSVIKHDEFHKVFQIYFPNKN